MLLNNFSSYFEIFTALNLAYAGSTNFRSIIDDNLLKLSRVFSQSIRERFREVRAKIIVISQEIQEVPQIGQNLQSNADTIWIRYSDAKKKIQDEERNGRKFTAGFKSMFLASGIYSLLMVLIGGFEQFFSNPIITNYSIGFFLPVGIFNVIIFCRSYHSKHLSKRVRPMYVIYIFTPLLITDLVFCNLCPFILSSENYFFLPKINVILSLLIAASPFLFHIIKIYFRKMGYRIKFKKVAETTEKELDELNLGLKLWRPTLRTN